LREGGEKGEGCWERERRVASGDRDVDASSAIIWEV
jgi:hypothetical protein